MLKASWLPRTQDYKLPLGPEASSFSFFLSSAFAPSFPLPFLPSFFLSFFLCPQCLDHCI